MVDNQKYAYPGIFIANASATKEILTMINERIALVMLDGEVPSAKDDPHHTRQFYKSMQSFADVSLKLCDEGKYKKLGRFLGVAGKLFREGNEIVKTAIVNIYLFTLSRSLDKQPAIRKWVELFMPAELRTEYARMLYASGM